MAFLNLANVINTLDKCYHILSKNWPIRVLSKKQYMKKKYTKIFSTFKKTFTKPETKTLTYHSPINNRVFYRGIELRQDYIDYNLNINSTKSLLNITNNLLLHKTKKSLQSTFQYNVFVTYMLKHVTNPYTFLLFCFNK